MKIAIIGAGNLGLSIAKGLISSNITTSLFLTKRNYRDINKWNKLKNVTITDQNKDAIQNSNIIIFTVQPNQFEQILRDNKKVLNPKHLLISAVTGFKISRIESIIGSNHYIIRSMPNIAISVGKSMTCISSNLYGVKKINITTEIFNAVGRCIVIEEEHMQAATVICASGIAFWMRLIRASTQGGVQLGFDADKSLEMSVYTALGAASLLSDKKTHPENEIDKVTTPRGCTISGLNEMEHQGLSSSIIKGIVKSFEKINEISNKS
jgi:pyrroline-5-carboxylate reductase